VYSPDCKTLASGGGDMTIKLWNMQSYSLLKTLEGHVFTVNSLSFHPKGTVLASGSQDYRVKLWDMEKFEEIEEFDGHESSVNCV